MQDTRTQQSLIDPRGFVGADQVIDLERERLEELVSGIDAVIDTVGGADTFSPA
jgi:hypothetical protein